jgi:hypothetical protein
MKRLLTILSLFIASCSVLTACQPTPLSVCVEDSSADHLVVNFGIGKCRGDSAYIYNVVFTDVITKKDLWSLEAINRENFDPETSVVWRTDPVNAYSTNAPLQSVTYGVTPANFTGKAAVKLRSGQLLQITVEEVGRTERTFTTTP